MDEFVVGDNFRSGFVAVVGRPNAGKSTLINQMLGRKIAIVSDKAQTTRNRIQAVLTMPTSQIVFIDTPGIHKARHRLGEYMVRVALHALNEVDLILWLVDVTAKPGTGDRFVASHLESVSTPVILGLNKVDLVPADQLDEIEAGFKEISEVAHVLRLSALTGQGRDELLELVQTHLPTGPKYYPDGWISDHPEQFVVAELVREKILNLTREEIPHSVAVVVESLKQREKRDLVDIHVTIYVERESQKGIVIGQHGRILKEVGRQAREEIEALLGSQIFLELWVKVKQDWRNKERALRGFGYE